MRIDSNEVTTESLSVLANAMPQLVWIAEPDGKVFYYNDRIAEFKGAEKLPDGRWKWQGLLHPEDRRRTEEAWTRAVRSGTVYEIEHRVMKTNGEYNWYLSRAFPHKDLLGNVVRWYGTATDVNEQKKSQELLRLSESEFRAMFEVSIVGMAQADGEGRLIRVNDALCDLTGFSRSELVGRRFAEFTHPDDRSADAEGFRKMVSGEEKKYFTEKRYIKKDGSIVWVTVSGSSIVDEDGKFEHVIAVIQNITDRKRIEQDLERLATHLKIATDSAGAGTWYYDYRNGKLEWSDLHKKMWGIEDRSRELKFEDWHSQIHDDDKKDVFSSIDFARDNHQMYEAEYRVLKGDEMIWVQSFGQFIYSENGEPLAITGITVDITEKKNRERELLEVKEQLELTVKNVPAGIMLVNRKREIVFANKKAASFLDLPDAESLMKGNDLSSLHALSNKQFRVVDQFGRELGQDSSPVNRAFATGKANEEVVRLDFVNDNQHRWIVYTCNPLLDDEGETTMVLATLTDITSQKEAEQRIRQSEEQLRFLAESIPQLVWVADENGNIEYRTGRWFEYSGLDHTEKDILGRMLHPDDRERILGLWSGSLVNRKAFRGEARLRNRNGEYRWHAMTGEPIMNADGKVLKWIGVLTDNDEQKTSAEKLELLVAQRTKELQRSNEDLQQFAHVASHDLKEPLRKIRIFGSRLKDEYAGLLPEKASLYLAKIERAANRMESMVDGVLQYSSLNANARDPEKVDLNGLLESIMSDLEILIQQSGAVITHDPLPVIEGAPVLIYQLVYNLLNNSLKFRHPNVPPVIRITAEIEKRNEIPMLKLIFEDNGIGFEMEYADSIFNSFSRLNSKDRFEGTGLGLALCKKIVERHHGSIEAWGEVDKGAKFVICLPMNQHGRMI